MPTANAEGPRRSQRVGIGTVSTGRTVRYLQSGAAPRRSPSACSEPVEEKSGAAVGLELLRWAERAKDDKKKGLHILMVDILSPTHAPTHEHTPHHTRTPQQPPFPPSLQEKPFTTDVDEAITLAEAAEASPSGLFFVNHRCWGCKQARV